MASIAPSVTILAGAVITMTGRGVVRDQAITVEGGRITAVTPRDQHTPPGVVVDWRDRTLLPGLADCHVHVEERADMLLTLAHGVTTVRNMRGKPWHLHWQRQVEAGLEIGPHLVTSTPMADGRGAPGTTVWPDAALIEDRETAHAAVERWAALGYQQVKAYQWLTGDALAHLGEACRSTGLPLVGHCPQTLTVPEAIDRGQTGFEHLNNYELGALHPASQERLDAYYARGFSYEAGMNRFSPEVAEAASDIDERRIADLAHRLADEDITSCPTLIVLPRVLGDRDMSDPRLRHVDPVLARIWSPENDFRFRAVPPEDLRRTAGLFEQRHRRVLAALRDARARVLVGTDTFNAFVFQGSSVVEEMELMTEAGYTPAELVEMATRGAADYLGDVDRGRVDVGFVADLVSVTGDPHASVSALRDPAGVVVGGHVLDRPDLDRLLQEAESLLHERPDRSRMRPPPTDATWVADYERTSFAVPDGLTRVSTSTDTDAGTTTWHEQVLTREVNETRTTVLDTSGDVVSAEIVRARPEGIETATASRDATDAYAVHLPTLEGATLDAVVPGPLRPAADLGAAAALASARGRARVASASVLTLSASLANGLAPMPGSLGRDGEDLVQVTSDAVTRLSGDDDLSTYSVVAPMTEVVHRRTS